MFFRRKVRSRFIRGFSLLALVFSLMVLSISGCSGDGLKMQQEIDQLREEVLQTQQMNEKLVKQVSILNNMVKDLTELNKMLSAKKKGEPSKE